MAHLDQFPMFRFATLLARQMSSPIANRLKTYARDHPRFGQAVCARVGRWYRAGELRFKMWTLQLTGPRAPVVVSDREAIDIGTDLLGEIIIFTLGALIVIFEVNRQAMKQEAKKLDKKSRWVAINMSLEELKIELEIQQKEIDLLLAAIRSLDPDVPLPQPSSLAKPLPHEPAAEPMPHEPAAEPMPPSSSLMKPLPQPVPGTDPAIPSKHLNALPVPDSSTPTSAPEFPRPAPQVVHPPGCTCVPPTPPPPPKVLCPPEPPPPCKPHWHPKPPPPTACG
ncbi:putative OPA3-like protein CG13603 [Plodia interpunctella]|uniref:putative OPA3-like protein CG13603 n=1 Tax=Plodia interpunctella TaxID=58824 RepID=UPI0023689950|nr:putative OPA3-like protein CG13603 [Plodia interpunctella]